MAGWDSPDVLDRFLMYLGRGNGGVMQADELWTTARCYTWLSDAQESVFADLAPRAPAAFVGAPVQLATSDGGVTYTYATNVYPFAHVEVYAQESGGRTLHASTYDNTAADFVIQGNVIRSPGNRPRTYTSGPWARFTAFPARLSASVNPSIYPEPARELILWKALESAAEVSEGAMDPSGWSAKHAAARQKWLTVWQTQYASNGGASGAWWLTMDALNGVA